MKYSIAAVFVAAVGAMAHPSNVTIVTEVVESYVTYCPSPTEIVHGSMTWTVTEPTTITITDCPCTITRPVYTTSSVMCNTCPGHVEPTGPAPTGPAPTGPAPTGPAPVKPTVPGAPMPTGGVTVTTAPGGNPTNVVPVPTAGAAKVAGLSGLVGLAGLAAFLL